jgi:hypothetical protein
MAAPMPDDAPVTRATFPSRIPTAIMTRKINEHKNGVV